MAELLLGKDSDLELLLAVGANQDIHEAVFHMLTIQERISGGFIKIVGQDKGLREAK